MKSPKELFELSDAYPEAFERLGISVDLPTGLYPDSYCYSNYTGTISFYKNWNEKNVSVSLADFEHHLTGLCMNWLLQRNGLLKPIKNFWYVERHQKPTFNTKNPIMHQAHKTPLEAMLSAVNSWSKP